MEKTGKIIVPESESGILFGANTGLDRVDNLELAACLSTLGFTLLDITRLAGDCCDSRHPQGIVTWRFSHASEDGTYTLGQVLAAWNNDSWLTDPQNHDPLAHIIVAFRNRQRLLDYIHQGRQMVAIKRGRRWALVPEDCSARVEVLAKRHLRGG